ncbi:MAG: AAA family ATPase, partial [Anaerolineae bacterium]
ILDALRQAFDFVVVDGGHAVNDATLAAIDETDELLLMTTPDIPSIKSVRLMLEVLDALDVPEDKRKLVISQAGRRYGVKVEDVERSLAAKSYAALPYDDAGPLLAANQGRPLFEIDPETPLCRAIMQLAKQVTGGAPACEPVTVEQRPKSRGLLSLWGRN